MARIIGQATGPHGRKQQMLAEAIQEALEKAPPPTGADIQHFEVLRIQFEQGGFTGATLTRVTMEVEPGPLAPV